MHFCVRQTGQVSNRMVVVQVRIAQQGMSDVTEGAYSLT